MGSQISFAPEEPTVKLGGIARGIIFSLFPILFLVTIPALPENVFWEVKDYRHWSERECEKIFSQQRENKNCFAGRHT